MTFLIGFLGVIQVLVSLLLVVVILMQRPRQEGLGAAFGGGMMDQTFGADTTNVLQKGTVWMAIVFLVNALLISVLVAAQNPDKTKKFDDSNLTSKPTPVNAEPVAPPTAPGTDGIPGLGGATPAPGPEGQPQPPAGEGESKENPDEGSKTPEGQNEKEASPDTPTSEGDSKPNDPTPASPGAESDSSKETAPK